MTQCSPLDSITWSPSPRVRRSILIIPPSRLPSQRQYLRRGYGGGVPHAVLLLAHIASVWVNFVRLSAFKFLLVCTYRFTIGPSILGYPNLIVLGSCLLYGLRQNFARAYKVRQAKAIPFSVSNIYKRCLTSFDTNVIQLGVIRISLHIDILLYMHIQNYIKILPVIAWI